MRALLSALIPDMPPMSPRERLRAVVGALVGLLATGLVARAAVGEAAALPGLIAPMGASAVLLFAVPASPLAQPWPVIGGNLLAALVGVTAARLVPDMAVAAALAAACAIALMASLRCLHPPSGAVALTAVLGGPAIRDLGYGFVLWPVAANSLLILAAALLYNNLTGRPYPHRQARPPVDHGTRDAAPADRAGVTAADLDAALASYGQYLDVGRGDLAAILRAAQMHAYGRRTGQTACGTVMSRDVVGVAPEAPLSEALELLRRHRIKALPVTDEKARILGIVTQTDLLDKAAWGGAGPRLGLGRRLRLTLRRGRAPFGCVADIMTERVETVRPGMPVAEVALRMVGAGLHHLPVVGPEDQIVGIVSQSDLVAALIADAAEEARAAAEPARQTAPLPA